MLLSRCKTWDLAGERLQEEKEPILLHDWEPSESSRFCGTNGIGQCTAWPARRLLLRGQGLIILLPASWSPLSSSESAPAAPRKQSSKASWGPHEEPIGQTPHHHKASFKGTWDYRNLRHGTPKVWRLLPKSGLHNNVQSSTVWWEQKTPYKSRERDTYIIRSTQSQVSVLHIHTHTHTHVVMEMMEGLGVRWLLSAGRDVWPGKC